MERSENIVLSREEAIAVLGTMEAMEQYVPADLLGLTMEVVEVKALLVDRLFPDL